MIVVLDQIEDPHNLGAVLRTCGFFDVSAVVVSKDHSCGVTPLYPNLLPELQNGYLLSQ
ncbi:MAG: hypothetical protein CM1200mP28_07640 [Deltaproteobacteria bacterium]|nr:MAG: hypothetical protein CM1200mP28_07640 [Deltaproteobacteria bacterium]